MKIFLTGGTGFVGSHTAERLLSAGHRLTILKHRAPMPDILLRYADKVETIKGDLSDPATIRKACHEVDCVAHLAWSSVPGSTVTEPRLDIETNLLGSIDLMENCVRAGVSKFIFLSTGGAVYGPAESAQIDETHLVRPISSYGASKLATEHYLHFFRKVHGLEFTILRASNVYGPRQNLSAGQGVMGVWLSRIANEIPLQLYGDGSAIRDYVYVDDLAHSILLAVEAKATGQVFNIGSGIGTSLKELLSAIVELIGVEPEIERLPSRNFDPLTNVLNIAKARAELNWKPTTRLHEGLEKTWAWIQELSTDR